MVPYEHLRGEIRPGVSRAEFFGWAKMKRDENMLHRGAFHPGREREFCPVCDNCLCGHLAKQFVCRCAAGMKQWGPFYIRPLNAKDKGRYADHRRSAVSFGRL